MKISEQFAGSYLKAQDLPQPRVLTIQGCKEAKMPEGDIKVAVQFVGEQKHLVLNKTNAFCLAGWFGDDTTGWTGRAIELYATTTSFSGRMVPAVRVRLPQQYAAPAPQQPLAPMPQQQYQQPMAPPAPMQYAQAPLPPQPYAAAPMPQQQHYHAAPVQPQGPVQPAPMPQQPQYRPAPVQPVPVPTQNYSAPVQPPHAPPQAAPADYYDGPVDA